LTAARGLAVPVAPNALAARRAEVPAAFAWPAAAWQAAARGLAVPVAPYALAARRAEVPAALAWPAAAEPAVALVPWSPVHPAGAMQWWARPRGAGVRGGAVAVFASLRSALRRTYSAFAGPAARGPAVAAGPAATGRAEAALTAARGPAVAALMAPRGPAAAVGLTRAPGQARAGESRPSALLAARRAGVPGASAWQAGAKPAVVSADPAGVGVEPGAAILVGRVHAVQRWAAAPAASPGAAHAWAAEAEEVAEVAGRRAETPVVVRFADRRA
jgi:hypothetical protein